MFTTAHCRTQSWISYIDTTYSNPIFWTISLRFELVRLRRWEAESSFEKSVVQIYQGTLRQSQIASSVTLPSHLRLFFPSGLFHSDLLKFACYIARQVQKMWKGIDAPYFMNVL